MKLYTEEQVRAILDLAKLNVYGTKVYSKDELLDKLTPIELPSDEEIDEVSFIRLLYLTDKSGNFRLGAKWVIEKIKQQDNDN